MSDPVFRIRRSLSAETQHAGPSAKGARKMMSLSSVQKSKRAPPTFVESK